MGKKKDNESKDGDIEKRETWKHPAEFVLCCLGYAVGLGNVWRFPYVCYENGGGAFLIPYAIMLLLVGIPVFFLELIMGQYSGKGPLHVWDCAPIFRGIGVGMLFLNCMLCVFYTMILGYALYYLVLSFFNPLPWDSCKYDFNSERCYSKNEAEPCEVDLNGTWYNNTCYNTTHLSSFTSTFCNETSCFDYTVTSEGLFNQTAKQVSSSEEYFNNGVLRLSNGIEFTGDVVWQLVLALLGGWILCYLCLVKGIRSTGKVVYFTALFPYIVLTILVIYGALLPGSLEGIRFYIIPDWSKLKTAKVWADAAGQIFFSLSIGGGGLMTFASYNKFHNNVLRDALIVSFGNCLTSFYAGFAIFAILGYMAHTLGRPVPEVVADGSTLAFVAYPTALARMPVPQLWSVLFFFMLVTLGLDSLFAGMETNITAFVDSFPRTRRYKWLITLMMCVIFFLLGLPMTTEAGVYWLNVIAYYATGWSLIVVGLLETMAFGWVYGANRIYKNVKTMVKFDVGPHWLAFWYGLSPALLIAILVFTALDFVPLAFGPYTLPSWAQAIGWMIALTPLACLIIFAIVVSIQMMCCSKGNSCLALFKPNSKWGPSESSSTRMSKMEDSNFPSRAADYTQEMSGSDPDGLPPKNGSAPPYYDNETFDEKF